DLAHYLADEPVSAGPPSAAYRFRKLVRRHKLAVATAAIVVIALAAGLAVASYGLHRARIDRDAAVAARSAEAEAREYSDQSGQFLTGMFTSINPEQARGRAVPVKEILDLASRRIDAQPPAHRLVEASLRLTFGETYGALGILDQAQLHLKRAVELYRAAGDSNKQALARALRQLGTVTDQLGKSADAEPLLR